jgi:hypothetical protein
MKSPQQSTLYLYRNTIHTIEGLIAIALKEQIAHPSIATIENKDVLLDHFWDLGEEVIEIERERND